MLGEIPEVSTGNAVPRMDSGSFKMATFRASTGEVYGMWLGKIYVCSVM